MQSSDRICEQESRVAGKDERNCEQKVGWQQRRKKLRKTVMGSVEGRERILKIGLDSKLKKSGEIARIEVMSLNDQPFVLEWEVETRDDESK